jgi:hypothetical protein
VVAHTHCNPSYSEGRGRRIKTSRSAQVNVTGLRDAQLAGKTLSLGISVRCFLERSVFVSATLVQEIYGSPATPPLWVGTIPSTEG